MTRHSLKFSPVSPTAVPNKRGLRSNGDIHPESNYRESLTINSVKVFAGRWKTYASEKLQNRLNGVKISVEKRS